MINRSLHFLSMRHRASLILFLGWCVSRFLFSLVRIFSLGCWTFLPGFLLALSYPFLISLYLFRGNQTAYLIYFLNGVIADSIFFWVIRPGTGSAFAPTDGWDAVLWLASMTTLTLALLLHYLSSSSRRKSCVFPEYPGRTHAMIAVTAMILFTLILRIVHLVTMDMPNEGRSLMIAGCEIHHAVTGSVALLLLGILITNHVIRSSKIIFLFLGILSASLLDESFYMQLTEPTDAMYNGFASWLGAIVGMVSYTIFHVFLSRRRRSYDNE